jgi:chromosome segregation ATPase
MFPPSSPDIRTHRRQDAVAHEQDERKEPASVGRLAVAETLRSVAETGAKPESKPEKDEEKMSLFWRVFGGTVLSISALVVMTLYNNLATGISDLRSDLNKTRDTQADLVKKDDFNTRSTGIYERLRTHDGMKVDIEGLRERVAANTTALDGVRKDATEAVEGMKKDVNATVAGVKKGIEANTEEVRKTATLMDVLKDRVAAVEAMKKDVAAIDILKDKVTTAAADVKALRDEVVKVSQETERNRSADIERKASQDVQLKQIDDALKDLQKGLIECREKLARLEGALPAKPAGKP